MILPPRIDRDWVLARVKVVDGCWEWTGGRQPSGYGTVSWRDGASVHGSPAHRVSYTVFVGPIPEGLHLDHLCRNRPCVRPEHLEAVTPFENARRASEHYWAVGQRPSRPRKTACPRGHAYERANLITYVDRGGYVHRTCRACRLARREAELARRAAIFKRFGLAAA